MSKQERKTEEVKPMSYSQRLIQAFLDKAETKNDNSFSMDDIKNQIEAFSKQEYEKRKEKTDEMPFGKYKFKKVSEVAKFDKQYLKWLVRQDMMKNYEELKVEIEANIK